MNIQSTYRASVALITTLVLWGCAELKTDLPAPTNSGVQVHADGWANPSAEEFHGNAIRVENWDMRSCQTCHGAVYDGGISGSSCIECHTNSAGPENCATCHGSTNPAPPRDLAGNTARTAKAVGAHQKHFLGSSNAAPTVCSECHIVPPSVYVPGHVDTPGPAEVVFNATLAHTVTNESTTVDFDGSLPLVRPVPQYDASTGSCANTYCHGAFKNGNPDFVPVWNDTSAAQVACGTCHGDVSKPTLAERALPKTPLNGGTHLNVLTCSTCHNGVVDANLRIINASLHMNGKLNVFGQQRDY